MDSIAGNLATEYLLNTVSIDLKKGWKVGTRTDEYDCPKREKPLFTYGKKRTVLAVYQHTKNMWFSTLTVEERKY